MRTLLLPILLASVALVACAATPEGIPATGPDSPHLTEVRGNAERFQGAQVRWGGSIAGVENQEHGTLVEVVSRQLDNRGRPHSGDGSDGRFLAVVEGFLDPAIHTPGRAFTVTGTIDGIATRPVGEHKYDYVRVRTTGHHLWPEPRTDRSYRHPPPYFYDPWYDPWHPWYPHPRGLRRW